MAHLGFIIVPTGYTHEKVVQGHGTPYGASSTSGQTGAKPTVPVKVPEIGYPKNILGATNPLNGLQQSAIAWCT